MAEKNGFRIAFRGFHRRDVMDYMDRLQADFSEREAGLREGLVQANAYLSALKSENEQLKAEASAAEQKAESIRAEAFDRFEQMNAELIALQKENEQLKAAADTVGFDEMDALLTSWEEALANLRAQLGDARETLLSDKPSPEEPEFPEEPAVAVAAKPATKPTMPKKVAPSARLVPGKQPPRNRDGLHRFLDGLLGG